MTSNISPSTALLTDHYELTMLQAALRSGAAERRSVFEVFARRLPDGRRYGVVAGTGRFLEALKNFRFTDAEIDDLRERDVVDESTLEWLADYRFSGDIYGYLEGECYFPGSPLLVVESTFAEGVLLETLALSILNHDSAVAAAASRMTSAAAGRPCIEMGSRRTHEEAAVAAARAAYVAGFATSSNLEAGRRFDVPTAGTSAHAFTLLHDDEREAFTAQVESLGKNTTLLVDTYDVTNAVNIAVEVAGTELGGVRLDSGDLLVQAREVRAQLDSLGAKNTKIVVTSDLDEYAIAALAAGPVDAYGVGTSLVTGSGAPTAGMVYKLVQHSDDNGEMIDVAKKSKDKISVGGRKWALRRRNTEGVAEAEIIGIGTKPQDDGDDREMLVQLVQGGEVIVATDAKTARETHERSRAELPATVHQMSRGEAVIPTRYEGRGV
ncbi:MULTISPECIES: nicotinate phosphoribosyltransferase [unclassified Dermacoccus]|uniref:nicotinate phosphoribosyltransferase n=1 Tax=unclassified Dermacoccus TaxID=2643059 RepID=UPI000642024A|nr:MULTISPECIES: nicotinate phosphoribosyltransferase [unclassified Dermacoccus]KLO62634.1 nicotinate phosphoribosyltransferase [Dermacoccus sp. PE3]MBZ4498151.1 nicotinate phosphoribosyltransferase [Dermacoccus sp. Tok2021]RYI22620.1 nicotinate phosphoribosyltransferase [Dermacoccus sp. 147Ba]